MMQLSRELKTLAREFSLAVVVSVAGLCPSCAGVWRGVVGRLWSLWERGLHSQLSLNPTVPCSLTSLQPADVLFQAWGKTWADVLPPALLSSASTAFTGLSKAELSTGRWKGWLCLFLIEHRSFKGLASSLGNLSVTLQELQGIASSHRSWKGPCSSLPQLLAKQLHLPMHPARWVGPQLMCLN